MLDVNIPKIFYELTKECLDMCTIILILSWHYGIINKRVIFFLQLAIEKLTYDYLNLFHFPPLIKVSKRFSY